MRRRLFAFALGLVLALGLAEVLVRLFVWVEVGPVFTEYDPRNVRRYKQNFSGWLITPEFESKRSFNSRGFREPEPPPSGDGSILFLGDSYTEGVGVHDGEEFPALVRAELDARYGAGRVPVVNAAMGNTGNGRWVNLLTHELVDFRPRLVVFQAFANDIHDNLVDDLFEVDAGGELTALRVPPPSWKRAIQPLFDAVPGLSYSYLVSLARRLTFGGRPEWNPSEEERLRAQRLLVALIERSFSLCQARGWPVALIAIDIEGERFALLQQLCARFQAPLLEVRNRDEHPELYYPIDGHWNQAGHRYMADRVLRELLGADSAHLTGLR